MCYVESRLFAAIIIGNIQRAFVAMQRNVNRFRVKEYASTVKVLRVTPANAE